MPILGAVIGWFTNFIAVKMLFQPREPKKFLLWEIQGVFPKRQQDMAIKLGKMVAQELFSTDDLKERLTKPEQIGLINEMIDKKINTYLSVDFPEKYPFINRFLPEDLKYGIRQEIMSEITPLAPKMIGRYVNSLDEHLDIEALVTEKVKNFSTDRLEDLMMGILKKELGFIEKMGFFIGGFVGLIQMLLVLLSQSLGS